MFRYTYNTCEHFFKINTSLKSPHNMIKRSSLGSKFVQFNKVALNNAKYSETSHDVIWEIYILCSLWLRLWGFNAKFNICICFPLPQFIKDLTRKNNLFHNCQDNTCRIFVPLHPTSLPISACLILDQFACLKLPDWFNLGLLLFYTKKHTPNTLLFLPIKILVGCCQA